MLSAVAQNLRVLLQQQAAGAAGAAVASAARREAHSIAIRGIDALKAGPGGRSSVSGITATIFGCSGFVGRYVAQSLGSIGSQLVLPYRCDDTDVQHLRTMGDLGMVVTLGEFDARSDDAVRRAVSQSNVVINLLGADKDTWNYKLEEVNVDMAARIVRAVKEHGGIDRYVHFSALGASADAPSRRLRSKAAGEAIVRSELPDSSTIFRLAHVVGTEDRFYNSIAGLAKRLPAVPLLNGGRARVQPVWVRDVANALMASLSTYDSLGKTYDLAGPDVLSMRQVVDLVLDTIREPHHLYSVPAAVARLANAPFDWLGSHTPIRPHHMWTTDYVDETAKDLILEPGSGTLRFEDLGLQAHSVRSGVPIEYLRHYRSGGYDFGATEAESVRTPTPPSIRPVAEGMRG